MPLTLPPLHPLFAAEATGVDMRRPLATSPVLPTARVALAPTEASTPTAVASPTGVPTLEPSPTVPEPTPTLFYIVPQQVEIDPTPVLAEAAPFPTSCDGPGRVNILLIGIDGFSNDYTRAARADTVMLTPPSPSVAKTNPCSVLRW